MNLRHATRGRLTNRRFRCPSCFARRHAEHRDLFDHPEFGTVACWCPQPSCNQEQT